MDEELEKEWEEEEEGNKEFNNWLNELSKKACEEREMIEDKVQQVEEEDRDKAIEERKRM